MSFPSNPLYFKLAHSLGGDANAQELITAIGTGGGGSGTVTTVSIVTANGVSGAVATPTTTPAITLSLGDITPTSVTVGSDSDTKVEILPNSLSIGDTVSANVSTPAHINLGGTFSEGSGGATAKIKLYDDGTYIFGFGVSAGRIDYICDPAGYHLFQTAVLCNNLMSSVYFTDVLNVIAYVSTNTDTSHAWRLTNRTATKTPWTVQGAPSQSAVLTQLQGVSSTSDIRPQADLDTAWIDSTDATRKARLILSAWDTSAREGVRIDASGSAALIGFFGTSAAAQQASGANLTNNVTSGGTSDQIDNFTDLTTYANDSAAIRNDIYQLARKLKQVNDALRLYGLLT